MVELCLGGNAQGNHDDDCDDDDDDEARHWKGQDLNIRISLVSPQWGH